MQEQPLPPPLLPGHAWLLVRDSKDDLRSLLADLVRSAVGRHDGPASIALSGGSLPDLLSLLPSARVPAAAWASTHWFFNDERTVPLDHADSNFRACQAPLFGALEAAFGSAGTLHPCGEGVSPEDYERELVAVAGPSGGVDLSLLGMGPDGHTASLFPGHAALQERERLVVAIHDSPKPPAARLTLTLPAICASRRIVFVVTGESKRGPVAEILRVPAEGAQCGVGPVALAVNTESALPAALARPSSSSSDLIWILDSAAAAELPVEVVERARRTTAADLPFPSRG